MVGIFLAVLVVGLALPRLWTSSPEPPPLMSLDFLNGRAITASTEFDPRKSPFAVTAASGPPISYCSWTQWYSFKADFSDVCEAADAELLPLGFRARTHATRGDKYRIYTFDKPASGKSVIIKERRRFVKSSSAQFPQPLIWLKALAVELIKRKCSFTIYLLDQSLNCKIN